MINVSWLNFLQYGHKNVTFRRSYFFKKGYKVSFIEKKCYVFLIKRNSSCFYCKFKKNYQSTKKLPCNLLEKVTFTIIMVDSKSLKKK